MNFTREPFDILYLNNQPRLLAYARSLVKDCSTAEDMVQDVFFTFWKKYSGTDEKTSVRILYKMTRNRCINYLQREKVLRVIDFSFLDKLSEEEVLYKISFNCNSQDDTLIRKEVEERIMRVIDSLPERCKEVFKLSRLEGMKNREIAEKLNISQTAVEKHIRRALSAFAEEAKKDDSPHFSLAVVSILTSYLTSYLS